MKFHAIAISRDGPLVEWRLCRPEERNPVDQRLLDELDEAAAITHDDPSARVVLLTAAGDCFSAASEEGAGLPSSGGRLPFRSLELMAQPVIACIEGDAFGAGLELALACDIRIAADHVTLAMADVVEGMMPSRGGTQRLPRLVGRAKAAEMILLGEPIDAQEAYACGLVNHVAPRGEVVPLARRIASKIAERGPLAVRYAKEAMVRGLDMPLEQALRYETDLTIILQTTDDRAEGVRAFLEKRAPRFTGR